MKKCPRNYSGQIFSSMQAALFCRRYVTRSRVRSLAEEMLFHLYRQILARARVGQIQPVFIDQHGLVLEPPGPCFLRYAFPDSLAEFARVRREIEPFGFLFQLA